jgi:hypothetical protein
MTARRSLLIAAAVATFVGAIVSRAQPAAGQVAVRNQGFLPYRDAPINYLTDAVDDPVARLQAKLSKGETQLAFEPRHGYLDAVLAALDIPVSSQTLVFSKTSFQFRRISPKTPRALYYNDDVYVGWVQGGRVLEFVSFDPRQGAIFYFLPQQGSAKPEFERAELDCTQCHVAAATRGVPGVLLRSIFPNAYGTQTPKTASFVTGHQSPFAERFGGWYVTGTNGAQRHMGNAIVTDREQPERLDREQGANVRDLTGRVDTSLYLTPHSDIVAQLVQAHQTQLHNLITLTNYQTRIALHEGAARAGAPTSTELSADARARIEKPAEELVRYLLFVDEAPLDGPVAGTSSFARDFAGRGPRDGKGRSLRDFDLRTRIFKYPLSYLIYTESFDALPREAKQYVYRRLLEVLTGQDRDQAFAHLTRETRTAILEILRATKKGLPLEWARASVT